MNERQTNTMATIVNMNKWRFSGYRAEEFQYYPHQEHWKETTTQKKLIRIKLKWRVMHVCVG